MVYNTYSGNCNIGCGYSSISYSPLESKISYSIADSYSNAGHNPTPIFNMDYEGDSNGSKSYISPIKLNDEYKVNNYTPIGFIQGFIDHNQPAIFLADQEVKEIVYEVFELMTGKQFPKDVNVRILEEEKLKQVHENNGGKWTKGIQGFAINRKGFANSEIFIKKDRLDAMMLTIGHELGHVMAFTLPEELDEEAKAFAFSLAWMETIQKHEIKNIKFRRPRPARNGLHDVAYSFVLSMIERGKRSLEIFKELSKLEIRCEV